MQKYLHSRLPLQISLPGEALNDEERKQVKSDDRPACKAHAMESSGVLFKGFDGQSPSFSENLYRDDSFILLVTTMEFTAIIRKGEKQFVALCPEVDVVSQGHTIEAALANLKEAVELYIEEMGMPKEFTGHDSFVARFAIEENA